MENGLADSSDNSDNKARTSAKNTIALLAGGILSLALLLVMPNQAIVNAAPFQPAVISISPASGPAGTEVTVKGEFFTPKSTVSIRFDGDSVSTSPEPISVKKDGKFTAKFIVPEIGAENDEEITVRATDNSIFRNSALESFEVIGTGPSIQEEAVITTSPTSGPAGTEVDVQGEFFAPSSTVSIRFDGDSVITSPQTVSVEDDGTFSTSFVVPDTITTDGEKTILARDDSAFANSASSSFEVTGSGGSSDQEADITLSPTSGPAGAEITVEGLNFTPLSTISITFDGGPVGTSSAVGGDGTFSGKFIVPDATVDGRKTIQATDDSTFANSASASFEVTTSGGSPPIDDDQRATNDAAARSQSVTIDEDASRLVVLKASHQNDNVHFSIRDNPSHGSLTEFDSESGTVLYTPYADYFGSDRFTFRVQGNNAVGTVSITIREVNDRPTARGQQAETLEESVVQFTLSGSDVDVGDAVTFTIVDVPMHGTLSGTAPSVTYLPDKDFDGFDSFRFRTSDGTAESDIATFSIRVTGVNDPPVVDAQTNIITKKNDDVRITLVATDIDSQTVSFSIDSDPSHGTLSRPMTTAPHVAMATYTPNPNYDGRDAFTFTVSDGSDDNGVSNTGRVSILIGSPINTSDESDGNTNTAGSESSTSPEGSGSQADASENGEINDALNGGTINNNINRDALLSFGNLLDTIPPSLIVPSRSIILDASSFIGATVNYESTANDNVDGPVTIHCYPRSGLTFPIGESVVKCNATDKAGNTSERSFGVIVRPFKFDSNSLLQLGIAIAIGAMGVVAVLMVIRKRRHNFLAKENYETTKLVLYNVYHLVKVACLRR